MSSGLNRTEMEQIEISPEALAQLGDGEIAYVKTIRSEDVHALFPQVPEIEPGLQAVRAARGGRHADHAHRFARGRDRQRRQPATRNGERALIVNRYSRMISQNGAARPRFLCALPMTD